MFEFQCKLVAKIFYGDAIWHEVIIVGILYA